MNENDDGDDSSACDGVVDVNEVCDYAEGIDLRKIQSGIKTRTERQSGQGRRVPAGSLRENHPPARDSLYIKVFFME